MKLWSLVLTMMFALVASIAPAQLAPTGNEPMVRVLIVYTMSEIDIKPSATYRAAFQGSDPLTLAGGSEYTIKVDGGKVLLHSSDGTTLGSGVALNIETPSEDAAIEIKQVPFGIGWWWAGSEDRPYSGDFEIRVNDAGKLQVVNRLPLELYLCGVVPSEIGGDSPLEAVKAQAVAARSETLESLANRKYAGNGYDICSDVECQAYSGNKKRTANSDEAVFSTRSLGMFHNGELFGAYYASNCGGYSENVENTWPERSGPVPFWSGHADAREPFEVDLTTDEGVRDWVENPRPVYCNPAFETGLSSWSVKNFRWEREFTIEEVTSLVAKQKDIGRVKEIRSDRRGISGRIIDSTIVGESGELKLNRELALRQVFDPPLRSSCFIVDYIPNAEAPEKIVVKGAGWGHGVGMCQTGAIARALGGADFRAIIAHYYRESEVKAGY